MEKIDQLRHRYKGFCDAVIHAFRYDYNASTISIEIECMRFDLDTEEKHTPWERVLLKLLGVQACRFDEPWNRTNRVLDEVTCLAEQGIYHFDFSSSWQVTLAEMQQKSTFYVMSKDFSLEVLEQLT